MPILRLTLCAALAIPIFVHAQSTKAAKTAVDAKQAQMKDEGDSFLGIPFASTFPAQMTRCPLIEGTSLPNRDAIRSTSVPCYLQAAENKFEILNGPDLGIGHTVKLTTYRDYPALFELTIGRARFPQMANVFSTRYGQAHRAEVYQAYTRAGETFQFQSLYWKGAKMTVLLDEGSADTRWSHALVTSRLAEELRDADRKRAAEVAAGKL